MNGRRITIFLITIFFAAQCWSVAASESTAIQEQIEQGDDLLSEDQFDRAITIYKKAAASAPENATVHQRLGKAMSLTGNLSGAERELRKAVQLDPNDALAHSNLGMIFGMQKQYADCIVEERTAIRLDPTDSFSYRTMGTALTSLGYYDDAIKAYQKAIELEPYSINAYLNLGATLGRKGDYQNAVLAYRAVLQLNPKSVSAHLGLGAALGKIGDLKGQIEQYQTAVALAPDNDNAHGRLGWAQYRAGKWHEALREGYITNWIRLSKHGVEYLQFFLSLWAGVFLLFGLLFAVLMLGSRFKTLPDEQVIKSYFLTFHKDRPGRFAITNKRIVFVPEAFSRSFGASIVSIDRAQIDTLISGNTGSGGTLILELKDGTEYEFNIPLLARRPLMEALSETLSAAAPEPVGAAGPVAPASGAPSVMAAESLRKFNARITGEFKIPDRIKDWETRQEQKLALEKAEQPEKEQQKPEPEKAEEQKPERQKKKKDRQKKDESDK